MEKTEVFQRQNQRISSSEILQAIADGCAIKLNDCTVSGALDINRLLVKEENFNTSGLTVATDEFSTSITISQLVTFNNCIFENNVCFAADWDKPDELGVIFKRDVMFNSSTFKDQTRFSNAVFRGLAGFDGCTFERIAAFRGTTFHGRAMFRTAAFDAYGLFNKATFCKEARFTNTCFSRGGNFTKVEFEGNTDFAGVYSKSKSVPIYESVKFARRSYRVDETFWRFIKQASQDAGYYRLAGDCFYKERCAHFWRRLKGPRYDELSVPQKLAGFIKGIALLPELILGRWLFGYGERPVRVLAASGAIILLCALFYASPLAELSCRTDPVSLQRSTMDGLYFSITTFATLGFGDIYPKDGHLLTRCVVMFETIAGASLVALFVVSLAKRFSRG